MTHGCPFLASAARQRLLQTQPGEEESPLFRDEDSFHEAVAAMHGPKGPLPLFAESARNAELMRSFLLMQPTRAAQAACPCEVTPNAADSTCGRSTATKQQQEAAAVALARRRLRSVPFARIAIPITGQARTPPPGEPPGFGKPRHSSSGEAPVPAQNLAEPNSGSCPMRRVPGFERVLRLCLEWDPAALTRCPPAIVAARAAVARLPAIQALRPQPLPARFAAVAAFTALLNAPCGAVRAHTRKFSWKWVLAVHASIPFIVMLRKALMMPPYAVLVTITAAVLGQAAGSRLEMTRLATATETGAADLRMRALAAGGASKAHGGEHHGGAPRDAAPAGYVSSLVPGRWPSGLGLLARA